MSTWIVAHPHVTIDLCIAAILFALALKVKIEERISDDQKLVTVRWIWLP